MQVAASILAMEFCSPRKCTWVLLPVDPTTILSRNLFFSSPMVAMLSKVSGKGASGRQPVINQARVDRGG